MSDFAANLLNQIISANSVMSQIVITHTDKIKPIINPLLHIDNKK